MRVGFSKTLVASLWFSTAAVALVAVPVQAQQAEQSTENLLGASNDGEAIVVTGQRTYYDSGSTSAARVELPILETPQAVFVINEDLITDQQAFRLDQVLQNDSSVQKSNNFLGAYSSYQIRGFSLDNASNYLRDGRTFFQLASSPVEVLDRVEVLKGPSSILYGTLAPGGLINLISKRPTPEQFVSLKGTAGSYDLYHAHLDAGGPIDANGNVGFRVNAVYENSDFFREFADGSAFNVERYIIAGALSFDLGERTSVLINADYTDDDRPQDIGLVSPGGDFSRLDTDVIISQPWTLYNSDVANVYGELTHELGDSLKLRVGVSYQNYRRDRYDNQFRGAPAANGDIDVRARRRVNRSKQTTVYADLISEFRTGSLEHNLLIGADYYYRGREDNETERNFTFQTNIFDPVVIADPLIQTAAEPNVGFDERFGVTIHDVISIGEQVRVLAGLRYSNTRNEFTLANGTFLDIGSAEDVTPRFGLVYLPAPNFSIYASYSRSFEPNAPVGAGFDNVGEQLDPTLGEQYEIGAKYEALGGRLLTTAALFTTDRKDQPFEDIATNTIVQRGLQRHRGAELTVIGLVNENITLTGSATYLDAEFVESDNPAVLGNTPAGVPEFALSLTSEYEFIDGPLRGLGLRVGVFHETDREVDDLNTYELDSYVRFDAGIKYRQERDGAAFVYRLTAENIFNEEYYKGSDIFSVVRERPTEIRASVEVLF